MDIQQSDFNCKYIMIFTFFFTALGMFFAVPRGAMAYDATLFVVEGVVADVTADDAVAAKDQAFQQAQGKAFDILANRLVTEADVTNMARPDFGMIASMIKDYEVNNEQLSAVRYVGEFSFRFDSKSVGDYFSISGVQYTDTKSKPLLILPVLQKGGNNMIWGTENIWLKSWGAMAFLEELVPVEVPIGDLDDVTDINNDNALRFERKALDRMLLRYNAKEAAIMIAVPDAVLAGRGESDPALGYLRVSIYRTDRGSAEYVSDFTIEREESAENEKGESVAGLYERAVLKGFDALQKNWKTRTAASANESRLYYVRMPVQSLSELVKAQDILKTLPGLSAVKVVSIKPVEAQLLLTFRGDENRLRKALSSGSSYTLSSPYAINMEATQTSQGNTTIQSTGITVMYDLSSRKNASKMRRDITRYKQQQQKQQQHAPAPRKNPNVHTF